MKLATLAAGIVFGFGAERLAAGRMHRQSDHEGAGPEELVLPQTTHLVETSDGAVISVIEISSENATRPLILLHGVTLRASVWHKQFELADQFRVFAVDLRAHGSSTSGSKGPGIGANAADLALLLEHFDLDGAIVVGHSMGGMILGRFLVDFPQVAQQRVAAAGFVSTAARNPARVPTRLLSPLAGGLGKFADAYPGLARFLSRVPPSDLGEAAVRATFGRAARSADVRETALNFEALPPEDLLAIAPSIFEHDVVAGLKTVSLPSAIIVGSHDPLTEVSESELLAEVLANSTLTICDQAGHQLMLERPAEVNEMIRELARRVRQ